MTEQQIPIYRLLKIRHERSPGCFWYEIECRLPNGETHVVAACDTREEARETIAAMRAEADDRAAAMAELVAAYATMMLDPADEIEGLDRMTAAELRDQITYLSDYQD